MVNIDIKLHIENLGPLNSLEYSDQTKSLKIGIFATNGAGKTFISRAFRLASSSNGFKPISNNLLTTNEKKGKFTFKISNQDDPIKVSRNLEINLNEGLEPAINNDTDYIFHVFNSDYVSENLEKNGYSPSGDIEGYILGKSNIDVTKEKSELEELKHKQKLLNKQIENTINEAKLDLDSLQINKNTKAYKEINFESVKEFLDVDEIESFESLKIDQQRLKEMPSNISSVPILNFNIDNSALNDIKSVLLTAYDKTRLHQDFINEIRSNLEFIERGTEIYKSNKDICPFCKQSLNENALRIIDYYNQYIEDFEAKIIRKIENIINKLEKLKSDINNHYNKFNEVNTKFNFIKKYLPSFKNNSLDLIERNESIFIQINNLINILKIKKDDLSGTDFEFEEEIININNYLKKLEIALNNQNSKIKALNKAKDSLNDEKLQLNKRLCKARYLGIIKEQKTIIQESKDLDSKILALKKVIEEKESKSKFNKKRRVIESLQYFLSFFFNDKYALDEENFCIIFEDESLTEKAMHVLSDGEKGIVAFCYYLATVHKMIENEEDYKKLFFVIDDPISSMDYNFVYKVTQCIRMINRHFSLESKDKFIILTHNSEFMNLLMSNKVIKQKYILKDNNVSKLKNKLILPYESHLSDIIRVYEGETPSYTTPNSIRHVLETICEFECGHKDLKEYILKNEELNKNSDIYSVINDLSHGGIRFLPPSEEITINASKIVVDYLSKKYSGQIDRLKS